MTRSTHARSRTRIGSVVATVALMVTVAVATAPVASAAVTCKVKNLDTTQRYVGGGEALTNAIAGATSGDRLEIRGTCVGTYTLDKDLRLLGEGSTSLGPPTLDGNDAGSVLTVSPDVTAKVVGLTITNGATFAGGGINNSGTLKINESTVSANTATLAGGGIENFGTLTINRSTVSGNSTGSFGEGGGIDSDGTLTVNRLIVSGNTANKAGGIHLGAGTMTVNRSEVSGNTATNTGGGFDINIGTLTLNLTTVTGNTAGVDGGGIYNLLGSVILISSTVTGNTPNDCVGAVC